MAGFISLGASVSLVAEYSVFSLLGVVGAIFANATGAGGGVVFVPVFQQIGFSPINIVATSFAIQCCGMTAGACSWWQFYRAGGKSSAQWQALPSSLVLSIPAAWCGLVMVQFAGDDIPLLNTISASPDQLHVTFGVFSIILGAMIFATVPLMKRVPSSGTLTTIDLLALPVVSFIGGAITAWLSVGVGELVAVYLIMRGFSVTMSIASAVILSAFSVWAGVIYHAFIAYSVVWEVVLFAGAGAIVGGRLARYVVLAFSPATVKVFFALWVLVLGVISLLF
ncbi:sulfite exporter TauE/SafE family protein [Aestuariibacter sp. A3R04]|nr:sulfite exporter TauE/SafE family protein [Aestuariibacter sp. A3R04]MBU3023339.1 sulfite exporter TauE/SafE family protein [Aestuariibacter sp. A3R04]